MTRPFERILIVMFENQYRSYVMTDAYMRKLARAGMDMTNYFGAFHPSQTNYVASLAGELCAVTNDTPPAAPLMQETLVDVMEAGGVSWKAYMEAYPGDPWKDAWKTPDYASSEQPLNEAPSGGADLPRYFRKHNAFASFHSIQRDPERWAKIVDETQFWKDVGKDGTGLPQYSWFTPDIWNDGHYLYNTHIDTNPRSQLIPQMATWLEHVFFGDIAADHVQGGSASGLANLGLNLDINLLLTDPAAAWRASRVPEATLIVVTFDEADYDAQGYDTMYDGPNQIYTVLLGDMITPGTVCDAPLNHYSLMRTVEKNYGLASLGKNDATANWVRPLWGESFAWGEAAPVGLEMQAGFDVAMLDGVPWCVFDGGLGNPLIASLQGGTWVEQGMVDLGLSPGVKAEFKLTSVGDTLLLVYLDDTGLHFATSADGTTWSAPAPAPGEAASFAATGYTDTADGTAKAMQAWQGADGFIQSSVLCDGVWGAVVPVGQITDGPMALAQFGPSLFLVYKERNSRKMRMTSMNIAPFNAFAAQNFDDTPAPLNDTSNHAWSPVDFPVGHFAKKFAALQNDYRALGALALAAIDGEMRLVHRGMYEQAGGAYEERFGQTGILTSSHVYSNGYGGLDQAGWTAETQIPGVVLDDASHIAMAADATAFTLIWTDSATGQAMWRQGRYSART